MYMVLMWCISVYDFPRYWQYVERILTTLVNFFVLKCRAGPASCNYGTDIVTDSSWISPSHVVSKNLKYYALTRLIASAILAGLHQSYPTLNCQETRTERRRRTKRQLSRNNRAQMDHTIKSSSKKTKLHAGNDWWPDGTWATGAYPNQGV